MYVSYEQEEPKQQQLSTCLLDAVLMMVWCGLNCNGRFFIDNLFFLVFLQTNVGIPISERRRWDGI